MHARRSLIGALAAALIGTTALAQVPGLTLGPGLFAGAAFSAWNPREAGGGFSFSDSNRTWANATANRLVRGSRSRVSGKYYFEITVGGVSGAQFNGVATASATLGAYLGADAYGWGLSTTGYVFHGGTYNVADGGATFITYTTGDVISVAVDLTAHRIWFAKNGVWIGDPVAATGGSTLSAGTFFPASSTFNACSPACGGGLNVGNAAFAHAIPSGFAAWR